MSGPMKARRIKHEISIQVGARKPRLFLVPKDQADNVAKLIRDFEVDDGKTVPWREPVKDLIDKYSEPGVMLKGARIKEGLSQSALARKLGIPPSNISEMESGKRPIGKNMAQRLSKILNVNYRVFL
jgi:ribosome-binding protein aMBF1 (putative translation factor)